METSKIVAVIVILILLANAVLFFSGVIDMLVFWGIVAVAAVIAFKVVPKLGK